MAEVIALRTFGSVYVAKSDGVPMSGAAAQRRLLALLALLAVGGERGLSRDRILGLLWPEADADRGRHALAQALYHARRTLGCDDLFVGSADLRLNPSRIACDVWEFEAAAARRDDATAMSAYRGAFLDGFFLAGVAEFDQWVSMQRDRCARLAGAALERLAQAAEHVGDGDLAVERWRQRVALDPFDSRSTLKLISALAASGDKVGALQQARVHEALVREALEVSPDSTVLALVERLRSEPQVRVADAERSSRPEAAVATETLPHRIAVNRAEEEREEGRLARDGAVVIEVPSGGQHSRDRARAIVAGTVMLVVVVALFLLKGPLADGHAPASLGPPVVVAPFRVSGADASLAFLREGLVELLSSRMATDSAGRPVDPGAVLRAWRGAGLATQTDVPRDSAVRIANRLGASRVVVGSAVGNPARLILSATLMSSSTGAVEADLSVEGPIDSLTMLVDRLAVGLMAAQTGESNRLALHTTTSPIALRAFLEGQAAYRRGAYADAVARYETALREDSTFALAAFQLALTADRVNVAEQHDRALALAWAFRSELNERDAAHLEAFAGPQYPAPSSEREQLAAWEHAVTLAPDRAEVWQELGERYFYDGAVIGLTDWRDRAAAALRRSLTLDPSGVAARPLLTLLAARVGDREGLDLWASPAALRDSMGAFAPFVRWRVAVARADEPELTKIRGGLAQMDGPSLRMIAMAAQFDGIAPGDAERAIRVLRLVHSTTPATELDALLAEHSLALNEGKPVLALDVTEQLQDLQPGSHAHLRLRVLDALYAEGDRAAAARAAIELEAYANARSASATSKAIRLADACVLGQWSLSSGRPQRVDGWIRALRAGGLPRVPVPIGANPHTCAELLDAWKTVVQRRADAVSRVGRLDSMMLSGPAVSDAGNYAHLAVARLYQQLGDTAQALAAIRRRAYMTGWPRYLATTRSEEGRLALQLGDTAGATTIQRRYLALREEPEDAVRASVEAVRRRVARPSVTR